MGCRLALVRRVHGSPKRIVPTSHKMPLANLCNRLVVNEHPWDPPIRERPTLAGLTSPSIAALAPSTPVLGSEQRSSRATPSGPKASSTSRDAAVGTARASCDRRAVRYHEGRLRFLSGGVHPCVGVFFRRMGRTVRSRTLPVALPVRESLSRSCTGRAKGLSTGGAPPPPLPDPKRLLPPDPNRSSLCWR